MISLMQFVLNGLCLLPESMNTQEARAMLYAIGFQESGFKERLQIGGPARGFWQFEKGGGIKGVLAHHAVSGYISEVCKTLRISATENECYQAVAYNDMLACCFARLLLYTLPDKLPKKDEGQIGWAQYVKAWRPGKPRPETWNSYFNTAWLYD